MMTKLVFLNGPEDGKEIEREVPVTFGRLPESDVPIPYDSLSSRRHAQLLHDGESYVLDDLGSSNGTFLLTGEPILKPTKIAADTIFRVGGVWFRLIS